MVKRLLVLLLMAQLGSMEAMEVVGAGDQEAEAASLRSCGFTAVSSTGVVPVTSLAKVAPAGTR